MKNIKIQMLAVIATIVLFSCTKTFNNPNDNKPLLSELDKKNRCVVFKTTYGNLKFASRNAFDRVCEELCSSAKINLDEWENNLDFFSLRRKLKENSNFMNKNSKVEGDVFKTLINDDGIIQIGEIIYKVNYDEGIIWSINQNYSHIDYEKFLKEIWDATKMNKFYINDDIDIYDIAESGLVGFNKKQRGLFGSDVVKNDTWVGNMSIVGNYTFSAKCKTSFQNLGIYKDVIAKIEIPGYGGDPVTMTTSWDFIPKTQTRRLNLGSTLTATVTNELKQYAYSGSRRCDGFINASFTYKGTLTSSAIRSTILPQNNF